MCMAEKLVFLAHWLLTMLEEFSLLILRFLHKVGKFLLTLTLNWAATASQNGSFIQN